MTFALTLLHLAAASLAEPAAWEWTPRPTDSTLVRAARTALVSARVCRAALMGQDDWTTRRDLGAVADFNSLVGYGYRVCPGSPLVLVHGRDGLTRLAPLHLQLNQYAYARTLARLAGCWGGRSVYVGVGDGPWPRARFAARTTAYVWGPCLDFAEVHELDRPSVTGPALLFEVSKFGPAEVLWPAYLAPADRVTLQQLMRCLGGAPFPKLHFRVLLPLGGLRLVAAFNPHGVELGVWRRQAEPAR